MFKHALSCPRTHWIRIILPDILRPHAAYFCANPIGPHMVSWTSARFETRARPNNDMHSRRSIKIRMDLYGLCASTLSTCVYAQARHLWQERAQPRTISRHCDTPTYACLRFVSAIVIAAISAAQRNIYGKRPKSYEFVLCLFRHRMHLSSHCAIAVVTIVFCTNTPRMATHALNTPHTSSYIPSTPV